MSNKGRKPLRRISETQDLGAIESIKYNDPAGAGKVIIVEPVVVKAVAGSENVGAGKYVKITGTSYTLDLLGKAYSAAATYQKGDIVTEAGFVYLAQADNITGAFDASKWKKSADKVIGPVTIVAGSVVCTGRWHNSVTTAGFLVDDDSSISHQRVRD